MFLSPRIAARILCGLLLILPAAARAQSSPLSDLDALRYVASYPDLIQAIGADAAKGRGHYEQWGIREGRKIAFVPLNYTASHPDLIAAFGLDEAKAVTHYIQYGYAEKRQVTFNPSRYMASHPDLIQAFAGNEAKAAAHYIQWGYRENRRTTFGDLDALQYLASFGDLIRNIGLDVTFAVRHYVTTGYNEGRRITFDALSYIASYGDLIVAFGSNAIAGARHYVSSGYKEGRQVVFDALGYLARHADLQKAFGSDTVAATRHYIDWGFSEGRAYLFTVDVSLKTLPSGAPGGSGLVCLGSGDSGCLAAPGRFFAEKGGRVTINLSRAAGFVASVSGCGVAPAPDAYDKFVTAPITGACRIDVELRPGCDQRDRKKFVFDQIDEWYLYPETLPKDVDIDQYDSVNALVDAMTATARAQNRDRYFTYVTSASKEDAYYNSGASAGFGMRLGYNAAARRVFVLEAFEGAPALAANIDRGDELTAIGTSASDMRLVSDLFAAGGAQAVLDALGPGTAGTTRVLRVVRGTTSRDVTLAKADYSVEPVSSRYGGRIIEDAGKRYGYINLRTFIGTADSRLREEIQKFRAAGITEIIVDFRYNGGGLISTATLMGDLLGGNRQTTEIFSQLTFRPSKSANDWIRRFAPQIQSASPTRLAFITTASSASASELVINGFIPFFGDRLALIGANTFGKPVGQIARDNAACDDRLRVVAFTARNAANSDAYFDGLAGAVKASCRATDDFTQPLGTAGEASTRQALDWLQGKACTAIPVVATAAAAASGLGSSALISKQLALEIETMPLPEQPSPAQRDIPGLL